MARFRVRRSLGQSFLKSTSTARALVGALGVEPGDTVLEIGPGKGALTVDLLRRAGRVVAVELDGRLVEHLRESLGRQERLELVLGDIMEYEPGPGPDLKVIGNLPYNISSQILFRLLDRVGVWSRAVLTTQREFAARVLGTPGSKAFSALSVFLERVCVREKLFNIPPGEFRPRPAVVSTAFRLTRRGRPLFEVEDEPLFRSVVKAAFAQRRKTLTNNLVGVLGLDRETCRRVLAESGVNGRDRAEVLSPGDFHRLYRAVRAAGPR